MTTAIAVAGYIKDRLNLPNYDKMKLQKLVYFSQAWALAWTSKTLFDEPFEAWPDGPVERSLYREQTYGVIPHVSASELSEESVAIIESVLEFYGKHSFEQLVSMTHEHLPWREARGELAPDAPSHIRLHKGTIRRFYVEQALNGKGPDRVAVTSSAQRGEVSEALMRGLTRWADALHKMA